MTSEFYDLELERDESLVRGLCDNAKNTRRDMHEWAEEEIKAVLLQAEIQEAVAVGVIEEQVKKTVERLRTISRTDLPIAIREHEEVRIDVLSGEYEDIHDAYRKLDRETTRLVQIIQELLAMRTFIGDLG